ncbi:hypothetical protein YH65_07645 [Sulfurovum lithotrophicum]|uniref:DUF302 domain-containing protein n=1 Tax=Sulfurovum lithotrophicum TaxID=206403 RepID=A0A7U4M1U6_9BACT|nr:DUF302 domain-containing protein [Sulfurovum lithotrophicum]AKF25277.1 hypothetical protein YH65_07645 [Sulfurovum lithotrophicum]
MIYKVQTTQDIDIVKEQIAEKARAVGFDVLQSYEFKKILHDKGYPIEKDITVFELCNPSAAQQALTHMPEVSVSFPCRISVYKARGVTKIVTIGLASILSGVNGNDEFRSYMTIIFENLKHVMHSWDD